MTGAHEFFEPTATIRSRLAAGKSVYLSAPVGARVATILNDTATVMSRLEACHVVEVELTYAPDGMLDIMDIWGQISRSIDYEVDAEARTTVELGILLRRYSLRCPEGSRLILMLTRVRSGSVQHVYDLLVSIHSRQAELQKANRYLQFLVTDHFALHFHMKRNLPPEESELYLVDPVETPVFEEVEIAKGLTRIRGEVPVDFDVKRTAKSLIEITGGHYSLLMIAIEHLLGAGFTVDANFWRHDIKRIFEGTDVVKRVRQALLEDREGIADSALKYTEGQLHQDTHSPRTMKLRALGALYLNSDGRLKLCGGFIRRLIQAVARGKPLKQNALGTFQTASGLAAYEGGKLNLTDGDLVIVHVSDLHVGEEHAFKFQGHRATGDRLALAEYIRQDLDKLGLLNRVDGLFVSGDITCRAEPGEFKRAEEVIREIVSLAGVPENGVAVVPGNHDIQWHPDNFAQRHGINGNVSRENFDGFYRNLMGKLPKFPEILSFTSRDGSEALDLVCLDSNHVEGPEAAGIGMIDPEALSSISEKLKQVRPKQKKLRRAVWFMSHHHYVPVCDVDVTDAAKRKVSVMANASHALSVARSLNVDVILHGHQHQPFLCHASRWMGSTEKSRFRPVLMVGAGSAGASRDHLGPIAQNHYFVLIRQKNRLIVRSRRFGDEGLNFTPHDDLVFTKPVEAS